MVTKGQLRATIGHLRATKGHLRVTIGYLRATVGHLRVTIGHLKVNIFSFFLSLRQIQLSSPPKLRQTYLLRGLNDRIVSYSHTV